MTDYDWISARAEYLTGGKSLEDISIKYGIPQSTLRKRAAKETWKTQRKENVQAVQEEAQAIANEAAAKAYAESLDTELKIAKRVSRLLERAVNKEVEEQTVNEDGEVEYVVNLAALEKVAKILKIIEEVKRSLCGVPTIQEDRVFELNRKRLEIEEKRVKQDLNEDDEGGGVLILPEVNEVAENGE